MLWWTEDLITGIEAIDNQHKKIFEMADKILFFDENTSKEDIVQALDFLISYVIDHFGLEEGHMIKSLYSDFYNHRNRHTLLISNLFKINSKFVEAENNLCPEMNDIIEEFKILILEWLVEHIDNDDRKFAAFIRDKE